MTPEFWPQLLRDDEFADSYDRHVAIGREAAGDLVIVSICRNAMPHLSNTVSLVDRLAGVFRSCRYFVFENDSADGTDSFLDFAAGDRPWMTVEHATLAREDIRGFQPERTIRLAEYRNRCVRWVKENAPAADHVVVLDTDAHGGFSVDGVLNSLGWLCDLTSNVGRTLHPGAMASHSLMFRGENLYAYDAWACRPNFWSDRRLHQWFHWFTPPIGSPPIPMNSAFGGLCLYKREAFDHLEYEGGDCEHVAAHRAMQRAGYQLYLNPGSRYVATVE
jgi:hypothetical protein